MYSWDDKGVQDKRLGCRSSLFYIFPQYRLAAGRF
jgi:hypothetical protein